MADYGVKLNADASGLVGATGEAAKSQGQLADAFKKTQEAARTAADESKRFVERLKEQAETAGKSRTELTRYQAAHMQLTEEQRRSVETSARAIEAYDRQQQTLAFLGRTAREVALTLGLVVGASMAVSSIKGAFGEADELHKVSQALGMSVESLSSYRYQLRFAGIENEQFNVSMRNLAKNVSEARSGVGDGAVLFGMLGQDIQSAVQSGASLEELLPKIADRISSFVDGATKISLVMALFGTMHSAAERLIPLLNKGSGGIAQLRAEVERMGIVISSDMARQSSEFSDNLVRVTSQLTAMKYAIANDALPWLSKMAEQFVVGSQMAGGFGAALRLYGVGLGDSENYGQQISQKQQQLAEWQQAGPVGRFFSKPLGSTYAGTPGDFQKQIDFLKFLQRQQVLARTSGMDTSDQVSRMMQRSGGEQAPENDQPFRQRVAAIKAEGDALAYTLRTGDQYTQSEKAIIALHRAETEGVNTGLTPAWRKLIEEMLRGEAAGERELRNRAVAIESLAIYAQQLEQVQAVEEQANATIETRLREGDAQLKQLGMETQLLTSDTERQRSLIGVTGDRLKFIELETKNTAAANAEREKAIALAQTDLRLAEDIATLRRNLGPNLPSDVLEQQIQGLRDISARQKIDLGAAIDDKAAKQQAHDAASKAANEWKSQFQRTSDNIDRALTDAIMRGFEKGKTFGQNFWDSLVAASKTAVLEPIIAPIVRPIANIGAGAVQGVMSSFGFGAAGGVGNLAGAAGLLGGGRQLMADFGNFFGSIGATTEAGGTFGLMDALGGFAMANPLATAGIVGGGLLLGSSLFGGGGGGQKASQLGVLGGPGGYYLSQIDVPGGESNLPLYRSINATLNDPRQFDQATLARLSGRYIGGGAGESAESMVQKVLATLEPAHQVAVQQLQTQQALLQQQEQLNRNMQAFTDSLESRLGIPELERYRGTLATAEYRAPLERLGAAQSLYDATLARAMGGDLGAVREFPQVAQTLLGISRDTYASGAQFQSVDAAVRAQLDALIGKQQEVQSEILKELPATMMQTGQDNVEAIRRQTRELLDGLAKVEAELGRIRTEMAA